MTQASDSIEVQASEWLTKADLAGSPPTWVALDQWLAASPRHRAAFLRLSVAWRKAEQLRALKAFDGSVDVDLLSARRTRARRAAARRKPWWQPGWSSGWQAAAAGIVALAVVGYFAMQRLDTQVYTTRVGNQKHILLEDGSVVELNTNSRLSVHFTDESREIKLLRGEAAFKVARNPARPFDVQAGETTVRALGTAFSVRLYESRDVDVRVTEGRVAIDPPSTRVMAAGEVAAIGANRVTFAKAPVERLVNKLAWTQGRLFFSGETLAEAVAEFNRYNRRQLVIIEPRIAGVKIVGTFEATNPDKFVAALEEPFGIQALPAESGTTTTIRLDDKDP